MPQIFNALNGEEFLNYLIKTLRERCEATGEFHPAITFPWVKAEFSLKVTVHPRQEQNDPNPGINITPTVEAQIEGVIPSPEVAMAVEVGGTFILDTPDQARVDSNQPIPTPSPGPKGILVDKPVMVPPLKVGNKK